MSITATRLRRLLAPDEETLQLAVNKLPFKVEIKSGPTQLTPGGGWILWFVLPEQENLDWQSVDLR